jgi:hypothetical protein
MSCNLLATPIPQVATGKEKEKAKQMCLTLGELLNVR